MNIGGINLGAGGLASNHNETLVRDLLNVHGMRVKIGCDVYDGSVQAGLAALEKRL